MAWKAGGGLTAGGEVKDQTPVQISPHSHNPKVSGDYWVNEWNKLYFTLYELSWRFPESLTIEKAGMSRAVRPNRLWGDDSHPLKYLCYSSEIVSQAATVLGWGRHQLSGPEGEPGIDPPQLSSATLWKGPSEMPRCPWRDRQSQA